MKQDDDLLKELLQYARNAEEDTIEQARHFVEMESPSQAKSAVDRAIDHAEDLAHQLGGQTTLHQHTHFGNSLEARFGSSLDAPPVLLLGHLDTVWDQGTLVTMPWKVEGDRLYGPGVLDMKLGVAMSLRAIEILQHLRALTRPVVLLLHGDEEIGSPASRSLTEAVAKECSAVYVLEPAQGDAGAYKTMRKGIGHYRLSVHGVAAHSGVDFERGHSAILELGRQLERLAAPHGCAAWHHCKSRGHRRWHTVPTSSLKRPGPEIDVRVARLDDAVSLERDLHALQALDKDCTLSVTGGINRPPMERTAAISALFQRAKDLAMRIDGTHLLEAATGGGSDGNFTAALGIPTLTEWAR